MRFATVPLSMITRSGLNLSAHYYLGPSKVVAETELRNALTALKKAEHRVQLAKEAVEGTRGLPDGEVIAKGAI